MNINNNKNEMTIQLRLNNDSLKTIVVLCFVFIMIVFLFVGSGGGAQQNHRLLRDLWDAGHLVLFGLLSFSYFKIPAKAHCSVIYKIVFTTIVCFVAGTAIEIIQLFLQRGFSHDDIINDVIGGYLGLLSLLILNKSYSKTYRNSATIVFILFLIVGLRGFEKHLYDEFKMHKQFPVLAGFETQLEMERWELADVNVLRSDKYTMSGEHSLKVEFLPGRYPTISLQQLKADWSGYKKLVFSVFNPNHHDLKFELKVYDKKHRLNGGYYNDRFNKNITLKYGWNIFEIAIVDIMTAPKQRLMDIKHIESFSLFASNLKKPLTIYLDDIHLE